MAKLTLDDVSNLSNESSALATINANSAEIETALENTLSRDGTAPNQMESVLDMNSNRIINLPEPLTATEPLRLQDAATLNGGGTIESIPSGGGDGDLLAKTSATDYEVEWITQASLSAFSTIAAVEAATIPAARLSLQTAGYADPGDGGGSLDNDGVYVRVTSEPAHTAKIRSTDRYLPDGTTSAGNGGWWELVTTKLNVLQLGADPTETAFSDTAIAGIDAYLTARDECRTVIFPPGRYKVFQATTPGVDISPLVTLSGTSFTGVSFSGHGATIVIDMPNYDDAVWSDITKANFGSVFQFTNVPDIKFVLNFEGDLTTTLVNTTTSPVGFIGLVLLGTCHNADVEVSATGIMMPAFVEASKDVYYELDATESVLIEAGGAGYAVNDTVGFVKSAAYGSSRNAVLTVAAVNAGAVTLLSVTDLGKFEYNGAYFEANAVPRIEVTDLGFSPTTLTGAGAGLLIRPFFRVGNREALPANQKFKLTAETCCRIATINGAGAIAPKFVIHGNHIQRAVLFLNDVSHGEIRGRLENTWLNCVELVHEVCSPTHANIDIDHQPTEGLNTDGWTNNSTTVIHDAQAAGPARFYGGKAVIRKTWPEKFTANGQFVWYPNAFSGVASYATEQQDRRHRIRDFELHVSLSGYPDVSGNLATPIVIGIADPGSGYAPYEAYDIAGMKVSGYLGDTAKADLPSAAFLHDLPDMEDLSEGTGSQILIDGSFIPQRLGGDLNRTTEIVAGVGGNITTVYANNGATGPVVLTYHNSASPAVSDQVVYHLATGNNSAAAQVWYGGYSVTIVDPTAASEDSYLSLYGKVAGALTEAVRVSNGVYTPSTTSMGADTINALGVYDTTKRVWSETYTTYPDARYARLGASNTYSTGVQLYPDGSVSAPSWSFSADANNGAYRIGDDNWALTAGGTQTMAFTATTVTVPLATTINNDVTISSGSGPLTVKRVASTTAGPRMNLVLDNSGGTPAANDVLGTYGFRGRSSTGADIDYGGFRMDTSDVTNGSHDGFLRFTTAVAGAVGSRLIVANGVYTPSATGGDKGADSINAKDVYDDGTAIPCMALEYLNTGKIDTDFWDSLVPDSVTPADIIKGHVERVPVVEAIEITERVLEPIEGGYVAREVTRTVEREVKVFAPIYDDAGNGIDAVEEVVLEDRVVPDLVVSEEKITPRRHEIAHSFKAMLDDGFDPRDPKAYIAKLKADRALPAMPTLENWQHNSLSLGQLNTKLWLATELLALTVVALEERITKLEARLER